MCNPQTETRINKLGLTYTSFAYVLLFGIALFSCVVNLFLYFFDKYKNRGNTVTMSMQDRLKEDYKYTLNSIGKESVYSYFVTGSRVGWIVAFTTLLIQFFSLIFFVIVSDTNFRDENLQPQLQFTWRCPRDSDECINISGITLAGWFIFAILVTANLAKDLIGGSKLIYHSSKVRHSLGSRIRYFISGMSLFSITFYALYVSICNGIYHNIIILSTLASE